MATIRPFVLFDLSKISKCNFDPLTETYDVKFYLEYYAKWPNLFTVCEDHNGDIIGYIMGKLETSHDMWKGTSRELPYHGHITALTVAPEVRGMGVAAHLTEMLEKVCEENKAWFVDLYVRCGNEVAIKMYKRMGYSVYQVVKKYYSGNSIDPTKTDEDAYDMRKPLSRDVAKKYVREDGEKHTVSPQDVL